MYNIKLKLTFREAFNVEYYHKLKLDELKRSYLLYIYLVRKLKELNFIDIFAVLPIFDKIKNNYRAFVLP